MIPFPHKIQHKILLPVLAILTGMLAGTVVYISGQTKADLLETTRTEALSTARLVAVTLWTTADTNDLGRDARSIQVIIVNVSNSYDSVLEIRVLDTDLMIISSTDEEMLFEQIEGAVFSRALENQHTVSMHLEEGVEPFIEVVYPVSAGSGQNNVARGVVHLRTSLTKQFADLKRFQRDYMIAGGLILLALGLVITLISRSITRPIQRLYVGMSRVNDGSLKVEVPVATRDEVGYLTSSFNDMIKRLQRLIASSRRFVPDQFLQALGRGDITDVALGDAINREMSVMFMDIRGFTPMSERMSAADNLRFLNQLLQQVLPPIEANTGFIDKYMGDALMALFDDPEDAVRAGIGMQQAMGRFNDQRQAAGEEIVTVGVGINHGELILGTLGSGSRLDTTVIGSTVNVAARVEKLTKEHAVPIILTESVYRRLTPATRSALDSRDLGLVQIVGVTEEQRLIGVLLPAEGG